MFTGIWSAGVVAALVLSALPPQSKAEFFEPQWSTSESGSLAVLPNPELGGWLIPRRSTPPLVLFEPVAAGDRRRTLWQSLRRSDWRQEAYVWITLLAPGPTDGASATLAQRHLGARGITSDQELLALVAGRTVDGFVVGQPDLDRVLAMRAATERGLGLAREPIETLLGQGSDDAFVLRAARECATTLGGPPTAAKPVALPALRRRLLETPDRAALIVYLDDRQLPPVAPIGRALRARGVKHLREVFAETGGATDDSLLTGAQVLIDRPGFLGYELARRFGNWRVHRTVAWFGAGRRGAQFGVYLDGEFDFERLVAGLRRELLAPVVEDGTVRVDGLPDRVELSASARSLILRRGAARGNAALVHELEAAGIGDAALWIHRRRGAAWPQSEARFLEQLAWLACFETFTLRASFIEGLEVRFTGDLVDGTDPKATDAELAWLCGWINVTRLAQLGDGLTVKRDGGRVEIGLRVDDRSATAALVRLIDCIP